jgi:ferredoxin--NADP+ reductase
VGLRTERTELDGTGNVKGTGTFHTWDVGAVYRAVGYLSDKLPKLPWDIDSGTVPDEGGRVMQESGEHLQSTYVTGWIRRGPIGLIGHTKGDANETVANLLADYADGRLHTPAAPAPEAVDAFLAERDIRFTTWDGWYKLDAAEKALGESEGRERVKIVEREEMLRASGA